ncbi:MAG: DNA polymerase III subunit chi [Burkholderiales bacterium]|nr:DNA polymerase III subunit chi [Burkholderiales bacterium]MCE7875975.1 DNA polymerase III subunit chi [Betaproteobacteria bacterium PRO3]
MTSIDFYTGADDAIDVAARLVAKAWKQHGFVRVLTPDRATTDALDRRLWTVPATAFVPHCRLGSPLAAETPVLVDERLEHDGPACVLVNLHPEPPPFFSRFERLADVVGRETALAEAGRRRWKFYRDHGYAMAHHAVGERT